MATLPPLTEQERIVAKLDEALGLCDRLEEHLAEASAERDLLLDALIRQAVKDDG